MERSEGHIAYLDDGQREAFEQDGEVFLAPTHAPIGLDGYRQGGRWECSRPHWDRYFEAIFKPRVSAAPAARRHHV